LEAELVNATQRVLADGENARLRLDTRADEDRWFGSQSGCRGEIELLLAPSAPNGVHPILEALLAAAAERRTLQLWVDLNSCVPGYRIDADSSGLAPPFSSIGALGNSAVSNSVPGNQTTVSIAPVPRILLLGGGPEGPPLIELARTLGWWLEVVEHRGRYLAQARLAAADRVHCQRPAEALGDLLVPSFDAVICATHLFEEDRRCLELLAPAAVPLVGVLGPVTRAQELLAELNPEQRTALDGRLHAPFGIALGAYGPEAVALSIAARLTEAFARG